MSIHEHHSIVILCDDCNEAGRSEGIRYGVTGKAPCLEFDAWWESEGEK